MDEQQKQAAGVRKDGTREHKRKNLERSIEGIVPLGDGCLKSTAKLMNGEKAAKDIKCHLRPLLGE